MNGISRISVHVLLILKSRGQAMKAIVYDKHGSPDVLVFREVDKPEPRDGEV